MARMNDAHWHANIRVSRDRDRRRAVLVFLISARQQDRHRATCCRHRVGSACVSTQRLFEIPNYLEWVTASHAATPSTLGARAFYDSTFLPLYVTCISSKTYSLSFPVRRRFLP